MSRRLIGTCLQCSADLCLHFLSLAVVSSSPVGLQPQPVGAVVDLSGGGLRTQRPRPLKLDQLQPSASADAAAAAAAAATAKTFRAHAQNNALFAAACQNEPMTAGSFVRFLVHILILIKGLFQNVSFFVKVRLNTCNHINRY